MTLNEILIPISVIAGPLGYWLGQKKSRLIYVDSGPSHQVAVPPPCPPGLSRIEQHAFDKANNPNYRGG